MQPDLRDRLRSKQIELQAEARALFTHEKPVNQFQVEVLTTLALIAEALRDLDDDIQRAESRALE